MPTFVYPKTYLTGFILTVLLSLGIKLAAQTEPLGFSLSGSSVTEKDTFVVTLNADSLLTGRSVYAYRFYISYSPSYFEFLGMDGTGPVLSGWGLPVMNDSNEGSLILAGAGTQSLAGSGGMLRLRFRSLRSGSAYLSFNTTESYLNEGNPASTYKNVQIYAAGRSYPDIYPDSKELYIGDEVKMTVSGGSGPYLFSTDDPSVALITNADTVRAVGPGTTRVRVTDANGEVSVTSGLFDVRAIRTDMEEVSVWPQDTFYIPVKLEIAPGTTVYSGRFDLNYAGGLTGLEGDILQGDFPVIIENNVKNGTMPVSFASTTGITGNGILCYLPFRADASGSRSVRFENVRFNETLLAWPKKSTWYVNVRSLPTLYLSPNTATLMWGEVLKLNVSNGTAPYIYSVSDPSVASVDIQGNLKAITGGRFRVSARDDNGATMTSGLFTVMDHQVSIFSTDGVLDNETRVPIVTSSLPPGKSIFGYKANVSFNDSYLEFVKTEPAGNGDLIQASQNGNTVEVAAALSQGVSSGVLGFMVFRIKNTLSLNATTNLSLDSFSANENSLYSDLSDGSIRRVEQTSYRPVAVAGLDFALTEGSTGQLDGTASFDLDNDPLTYRWSVPEGILLSDTTSATPEFIAPGVDKDTVFTFRLVVNDGTNDSDPSQVKVTVLQVNFKPVANAGADLNFVEGSSVSLDGSGSYDPDGDALSYRWEALDGIVLFNAGSMKPSFILPQVSVNTSYRFTLVVNDGALNSNTDTVSITAIQVNKKPVAFAGGDFSVDEHEQYTLDGSLSYDADNDPLTYHWMAPPQVTLSSATVARPSFTAPPVLRDSVLTFTLVVNDGTKDSDPDIVKATVINLDVLSTETNIDSVFMAELDSVAIDTVNAEVTLYMPYGLDVRSLSPELLLSAGAMVSPPGGSSHDFSMPVWYKVTAEDGITSRMWKVRVYRPGTSMQRTLQSGWNWISLNVQPASADINALLGGLTLNDQDYLKTAAWSSIYYSTTGWFGNLSAFPPNRMVKFKKAIAEEFTVQGLEINPTINQVPLQEGWNDIAYLLRSDARLNGAIVTSSLPAGDIVLKGETGSAVWYAGSGWSGELDTLRILHGYKMNVQEAGTLAYQSPAPAHKSAPGETAGRQQLLREYQFHPENYGYSSTLIAEAVAEDGKNITREGDLMLAYHEGDLRGIARSVYVPTLAKHLFILTCYSNEKNETFSFHLRTATEDTEYPSDLSLHLQPDEIAGEPYRPLKLTVNLQRLNREDQKQHSLSIYPNPITDLLTISSTDPVLEVSLYDMSGKIILHRKMTGYTFSIPLPGLDPGIYTLKAETADRVFIEKVIKTAF